MKNKILVTGGEGRFATVLKKDNKKLNLIFTTKSQCNILNIKSIENINLFSVASLVVLSAVTFALQVYFTLALSGMFMSLNPSSLLLAVATQLLFYFYSQGLIGVQNHKGYSLALAAFSTFRHLCALAALHLGLTLDSAIAGQFILMFFIAI